MKRMLIIEDNEIIINVYRNKCVVDGYQVETALDGETGLKLMRTFKPDLMLLDLMLPKMSGVDVIKVVRSESEFAKLPIIVFSNTYLTNVIQDAWKAGANKCLSKASCSPKDLLEIVRTTIGGSAAEKHSGETTVQKKPDSLSSGAAQDAAFQSELRKTFLQNLPATLTGLRAAMQHLIKANGEVEQ